MKVFRYIAVIIILLTVVMACSTKKKARQHPSRLQEAYHNLTARYNGYFHAKLKLKNGLKNLNTSHKDNYEEVLPIYPYSAIEDASTAYPDMDEVIKKSSFVIQIHEISKWVDDSYLLIGQALYLKKEHDDALATFDYINAEFKDIDKKRAKQRAKFKKKKKKRKPPKRKVVKRKKPKKKPAYKKKKRRKPGKKRKPPPKRKPVQKVKKPVPKSTSSASKSKKEEEEESEEAKEKKGFFHFLKHKPIRDESVLWLIKTYIDMGKYEESEAIITVIKTEEPDFPEKLKPELEVLHAYHFLKQEDYDNAIEPLQKAIEITKNKKARTRYQYILAQIYQLQGNNVMAMESFQQVLKGRPPYEMEFNAKINIAKTYDSQGSASTKEIMKILEKMLKDEKNEDYFDQIYYTMAEIALKENDIEQAKEYLKKSVSTSRDNQKQKALSYLKLAELYYAEEQYIPAKSYYDSTMTFLPKDHENYASIEKRGGILGELVRNLDIIHREDSLLKLAAMPKKQRERLIDELIAKKREKEAEDSINQDNAFFNQNQDSDSGVKKSIASASTWYFYNASAKSSGFSEFKNVWGSRKLEDNWRRSDRSSFQFANNGDGEGTDSLAASGNMSDEELKAEMLKGIPVGDEATAASREKIFDAYYSLANVYKDKLQNTPKAIETFEEFLDKYPENKYKKEVYYNLYLLYAKIGNSSKSNHYKNLLRNEEPESLFAKLVDNPNYLDKNKKQEQDLHKFYAATYDLYLNNNFEEVIRRKTKADELFKENNLKPKFAFLEALSIGKTQDKAAFKSALEQVINNYPEDEVKTKAQEILSYLIRPSGQKSKLPEKMNRGNGGMFSMDEDIDHYIIVLLLNPKIKLQDVMNEVSDYNSKFHRLKKLKISKMVLAQSMNMIVIKKLDNKQKGEAYYKDVKNNKDLFKKMTSKDYELFAISSKNYNTLLKNKDPQQYLQFFRNNYQH